MGPEKCLRLQQGLQCSVCSGRFIGETGSLLYLWNRVKEGCSGGRILILLPAQPNNGQQRKQQYPQAVPQCYST